MTRSVPRSEGITDRARDLLVSGHVNVDRFLRVAKFPTHDRTVPVEAHRVELGGTATNIALAATRYGVATGLMAQVGDEFPARFWAQLRRAHIDLRGLDRVRGIPTPSAIILEDRKGNQRTLMDQGPMGRVPLTAAARPWLAQYAWVHLTTGDPDFQLHLMNECHRRGMRVAADPAQEVHYRWDSRQLARLLAGAEILFGNRGEIERVAAALRVRGPHGLLGRVPLVVRTEGEGGASGFTRIGSVHVASVHPRTVRTVVGAGDAFRGGFYAAWFEGEPLRGCLRAGTRAAAHWMEGAR